MYSVLRQAAAKGQVTWDDFDAAVLDDYRTFGRIIDDPKNIAEPDGKQLFIMESAGDVDALYTLTRADVQVVAQGMLGQELSDTEIAAVATELPSVIKWMYPIEYTIWSCQQAGSVTRAANGHLPEMES